VTRNGAGKPMIGVRIGMGGRIPAAVPGAGGRPGPAARRRPPALL